MKLYNIKITGTLIKNYFHCKRQAWLYYYGINFENELSRIGTLMHFEAGSDELAFDQIKIDKIKGNKVIEFKKSSSNLEGAKYQLLYYLYILKQNGINKQGTLKDLEFGDTYQFVLDSGNLSSLKKVISEIKEFINSNNHIPARKKLKKECKGCSFFEYCWS